MSSDEETGCGPSKDDLRRAAKRIVAEGDLEKLTKRAVFTTLSKKFNTDLAEHKRFIYQVVKQAAEERQNGEEDDAEMEENDDEPEPTPPPKRTRRRKRARSDSEEEAPRKRKKRKRQPKYDENGNEIPSPQHRPQKLSEKMAEFMGVTTSSRHEVRARVNAYVKENGLQDEDNKREFDCDEVLRELFDVSGDEARMTFLTVNKYITPHLIKEGGNKKAPKRKFLMGIKQPYFLSKELEAVVGEGPLSRQQIVKKLWAYVKERDLQDPENKKEILCDDKLQTLFDVDRIVGLKMSGGISPHLTPVPNEELLNYVTQEEIDDAINMKRKKKTPKKRRKRQRSASSGEDEEDD